MSPENEKALKYADHLELQELPWQLRPHVGNVVEHLRRLVARVEELEAAKPDEDFVTDARRILADVEGSGDPFYGDDWSLVQILRGYIRAAELLARKEDK